MIINNVQLPIFQGFYDTLLSYDTTDIEWTLWNAPNKVEENNKQLYDWITENIYDYIDYRTYEQDVSRESVGLIFDLIKKSEYGKYFESFTFEELTSPKEYNFTTDKVYMEVECDYEKLVEIFRDDAGFHKYVRDVHKSRDGFWSFVTHTMPEYLQEDKDIILQDILAYICEMDDEIQQEMGEGANVWLYEGLFDDSLIERTGYIQWSELNTATIKANKIYFEDISVLEQPLDTMYLIPDTLKDNLLDIAQIVDFDGTVSEYNTGKLTELLTNLKTLTKDMEG